MRYIGSGDYCLDDMIKNLKREMRYALIKGYKIKFNRDDDSFCSDEMTMLNSVIRAAVKGCEVRSAVPIYDLIYTLLISIEGDFVLDLQDGLKVYKKKEFERIIIDFEDTVGRFLARNFYIGKDNKKERVER